MSTIIVWVLLVTFSVGHAGVVIDNIASPSDCQALANDLQAHLYAPDQAHCVAVRKVRQ